MGRRGARIFSFVRNFLSTIVNKEFLIFLFFLALSGVFWLLMALNETYEKEYAIPVRLIGTPRNVVITTNVNDTIRVTVRDKGFSLIAYSFGNQFRPLNFRFQSFANEDKERGTIPNSEIQKQVYAQLYSSTKIVQMRPDRLEFYFNYGLSKRVPVHFRGTITAGKSYYLARTALFPDIVTIYASKRLLDSVKFVTTENIRMENVEDTVYQRVKLHAIRGVKIVPDYVKVGFYPDILTEEVIEVPIVAINMPSNMVLRTFPGKVKVRFIVGASQFRSIQPDMFKVVADYKDLIAHPSDKCLLTLKNVPKSVSRARLEINQVDYLLEQR